jgi:MFS family permease
MPRGVIVILAVLTAIMFLVEGALLDWSAVLITSQGVVGQSRGGVGYMLFAIAMTVGRLSGDALIAKVGDRAILISGGVVALAGFAMLLLSPSPWIALTGFVLIGLGAANIVPVFFRLAGTQQGMPANPASRQSLRRDMPASWSAPQLSALSPICGGIQPPFGCSACSSASCHSAPASLPTTVGDRVVECAWAKSFS